MAKVIGPTPTPPLCRQCRAAYINQHHINYQQGLCGFCWQRLINEQRQQRDKQEQSRRQQNSTSTYSGGPSASQFQQPQFSQPIQAGSSDAGNAAAGGCLVIAALFFLPYVGFNWMFRGSPFSMNQFIDCLDNLSAWVASGLFWLFVVGLLNSRK